MARLPTSTKNYLTPSQLLDLSVEPNWTQADPEQRGYLAVDLAGASHLNLENTARLCAWMVHQPIPTVGVHPVPTNNTQGLSTSPPPLQDISGGGSTLAPGSTTLIRRPESSSKFDDNQANTLYDAVDLVVANPTELQRVGEQIGRFPRACSVLVQVLRVSSKLSMMDALAVESLAYGALQGGSEFDAWLKNRPQRKPKTNPDRQVVLIERDGVILQIVLNSPDNRNALSTAMRDALTEAFQLAVQDASIEHIEVSANGPCFSAGGDLTEFGTMTDLAQAHHIRMTQMPARYLAACRDRCTFRVHGTCIGAGIEMPAFAARLVAKPNTTFLLPEVGMGLIPGAGGCVSIPRRIGRQRTALWAILGDSISAEQALDWGLIDAIEH